MKRLFLLLPLFVLLLNFSSDDGVSNWVENKLRSMTLREKIAQMIVSYSDGYALEENSTEFRRLNNLIVNEKIGGIIFFKGNALQQAHLTNRLQELAVTPLLISQDCERGTGMRLYDGSIFPSNMALGASRDSSLAYQMGRRIAIECKAIGVNQNYAPVMDVNNNPLNPIINVRSFGEDPALVSYLGISMIKGMQDNGIIATAKHFPGHGDTEIDSHNDLPVLNINMERLRNLELVPFKNAIDAGVESIMIAHVSIPAIDDKSNLPASLSPKIVNDILSGELGFNGLKVTDALNMAGITKHYSVKEVAVMCVKAGIDLILMPQNETASIDAIENAVLKNEISEERITASAKKILEAKNRLGLNEKKYVDENAVSSIVNSEDSKSLSQKIADASITKVKDMNGNVPFGRRMIRRKENCLIVSLNNGSDVANSDYFINKFKEKSSNHFTDIFSYDIIGDVNNTEEILKKANDFTYVVIPVFAKVKIKTGTVGLPASQLSLINSLIQNGKQLIVISFGNPYLIQGFKDVDAYICAYGDSEPSINAAIKAMFGEIQFKGKLPVSISEEYKFGAGLTD